MKLTISLILLLWLGLLLPAPAQQRPIAFEDMFAMGRVADAQISPDGKWIAYTVTYYRLEDNSSNSDIHLVSADGKVHKQLTFHPRKDFSPRWSPDGGELAFLSTRDGSAQIYRLDISGGEARKSSDIPTGVNDFSWSPDGKYFAVATDVYADAPSLQASADKDAAREKSLVKARIIDRLLYRQWNAWREGKFSHVVVVPVTGGETVDVTTGEYDTPPLDLGSSHDFVWSPDSRQLAFVRNADPIVAASTNNDIFLVSREGGAAQAITSGRGNDNGPRFSPDGKLIAYLSMARPGFEADQQDLMIYDPAAGAARNLTATLDLTVSDYVWAPDGSKIYFYSPYHGRHRVFQVEVASARRTLLLEGRYVTELAVAPNNRFLVLKIQAANHPDELYRLDPASRKMTQLTFTNDALLAPLKMNPLKDYWFVGANNDSVHLLMLRPPDFDPSRKYPLLCLIHGGPQGAWGDDFHYRWNSEMFAAPGYVVIMINFHGSRGYGQAFCDAVSKNWGGWPFEDIVTGTRWAMEHFDFIDPQRVGAAGASYGGFMINWIEGHNDDGLFKTLVCHDGVFEQVGMFGGTEELWFPLWEFNGMPWEAGSLYQKWNPINYADYFKTPMLVVHGEHDYRVPYTQGLELFSALQMKGVPSRLLFFPDEDHFVRKPQNARLWWEQVHGWLAQYLKP